MIITPLTPRKRGELIIVGPDAITRPEALLSEGNPTHISVIFSDRVDIGKMTLWCSEKRTAPYK